MSSRDERHSSWLMYAVLSGTCAAINGVFAKLTTNDLTTSWARSISTKSELFNVDLHTHEHVLELGIRGVFLALNLSFNGVMWALFTRALTLSSSTVRVSVLNTAANFGVTALSGAVIFGEELPGLWWVGAAMLVAGCVIIGARDESSDGGDQPVINKATSEQVESAGHVHNQGDAHDVPTAKIRTVQTNKQHDD